MSKVVEFELCLNSNSWFELEIERERSRNRKGKTQNPAQSQIPAQIKPLAARPLSTPAQFSPRTAHTTARPAPAPPFLGPTRHPRSACQRPAPTSAARASPRSHRARPSQAWPRSPLPPGPSVSARAARPRLVPRSLPGRAHASGLSPSSRNGRAWHAEIPGGLSLSGSDAEIPGALL